MTFPRGMRPWLVITASLCLVATAGQRPADPVSPQDLKTAIDTLGRLDYAVRMNAARTVRRAGAAMATRALMGAVSGHADGYVRYRALVLLSGFNDPRSRDLMEEAMGDKRVMALVRSRVVFDEAFFGQEFAAAAEEFSREHGGLGLRVELVTAGGERLDALELDADGDGVRIVTRDDRLVLLPYAQIAHVDVSLLRDHRIESFELPASE